MYKIYQINTGDTLDSISKKLNTTIDELKKINGIKGNMNLMPGGFLIVPSISDKFIKYTIKKGDTIYSIASNYNVDPNILLEVNGLEKDDFIYPDNEIIIPNNNYNFYITKESDTLDSIIRDLNIDYNNLLNNNDDIYLKEEQLIIYK